MNGITEIRFRNRSLPYRTLEFFNLYLAYIGYITMAHRLWVIDYNKPDVLFQRTSRCYQLWTMFERLWKHQKVHQKLFVAEPVKPNPKRQILTHYPMLHWLNRWPNSIMPIHLRTHPQSNENDERFRPWQPSQFRHENLLGRMFKRNNGLRHRWPIRLELGSVQGKKRIKTIPRQGLLQLSNRLTWKVPLQRLQERNRDREKQKRQQRWRKRW